MNTTNTIITEPSIDFADALNRIGFGPARSRSLALKRTEFCKLAVDFRDACQARGFTFRVFQSSGCNGYYARLRLMVITGSAPNNRTDSRGYTGSMEELQVGSMSTTKGQVYALVDAIADLADEVGVDIEIPDEI